jgi:hypothetical protein
VDPKHFGVFEKIRGKTFYATIEEVAGRYQIVLTWEGTSESYPMRPYFPTREGASPHAANLLKLLKTKIEN